MIVGKCLSKTCQKISQRQSSSVIVCSGHYVIPRLPKLPGHTLFNDMCRTVTTIERLQCLDFIVSGWWLRPPRPNETPEAFVSRKLMIPTKIMLSENVKRLTEIGAEFIDGTHDSAIIYGAGYDFRVSVLDRFYRHQRR